MVYVDNGTINATYKLDNTNEALWIKAGVWIRLQDFSDDAILLVMSPAEFGRSAQFDSPQPNLIEDTE
jgi:hypothetical protein